MPNSKVTKFTRSQYAEIAEILFDYSIKQALSPDKYEYLVNHFCIRFEKLNPNFKPHLFKKAAGITT